MDEDLVIAFVIEMHRLRGAFRPRRTQGDMMLKPYDIAVMHRVFHKCEHGEKAFPSLVGDEIGFSRSFVAQILTRLEDMGLITRSTQKSDRRMSEISLTEKGLAILRNHDDVFKTQITKLIDGLGEADSRELLRLMRRAIDILASEDGEDAPHRRD